MAGLYQNRAGGASGNGEGVWGGEHGHWNILWAARATGGETEGTCAQQLQGGVAGEAIPKGAGGLVNVEDDTKLATGWEDRTPRDPTLRAGPAEPGDYTNGPQKEEE